MDLNKYIFVPIIIFVLLSGCLSEAKAQKKPIFDYARSQVCGWCKKSEAETFTKIQ